MAARIPIVPADGAHFAARRMAVPPLPALDEKAVDAERILRDAEGMLRTAKVEAGIRSDPEAVPPGLLGAELTPLVTTLGSLEAKRTAADPRWASALTRELSAEGIGPGDVVAAGFSGSFPGLNVAVMAASHVLGARLAAISSVTASTWGADEPGFTWPEMECRLVASGLLPRASIAVTAGGDDDVARDLEPEARRLAITIRDTAARRLGVPALRPASLDEAVRLRMGAYRRAANGRPIGLYINVGGTAASLGESAAVLRLRSGFVPARPFDRSERRGVMARFSEQGVRGLMLLNVRDLALRWGIPLS